MYPRNLGPLENESFFLLGPRGTGKSTWVKHNFTDSVYIDLLDEAVLQDLLRDISRFRARLLADNKSNSPVIVDEIQRLPALLNEVHRLIEEKKWQFILTGSSARKLRRAGTNLLAGRARQLRMFPLTATELGADFELLKSLRNGHLPVAYTARDPQRFLKSYTGTYLKEEVQQEALVRRLPTFAHFLEAAAFSQASVLTVNTIAQDCGIDRKTAENYFTLLEDLLLSFRLPVFQRKAKRKMSTHPKFFYFDTGIYRSLRKMGPLDSADQIDGAALETLVIQEMRAQNANLELEYDFSYWRPSTNQEVDFVLYGPRGFWGIEVKRTSDFRRKDLSHLKLFIKDYKEARGLFLYTGKQAYELDRILVKPVQQFLVEIPEILS